MRSKIGTIVDILFKVAVTAFIVMQLMINNDLIETVQILTRSIGILDRRTTELVR